MMRRLAPKTAMAIAEYFRDQGELVLLIVDSVTRFAHAARDVALAAGEPAVARGYAPSVFSDLPRLLERAGPGVEGSGSITGVFSVLVDGDDHNDPVADAIRGALDGHIVLDRAIADEGRYPAVNVLSSVSRMAHPGWRPEQRKVVANLRSLIARYEETRELRLMGGYTAGADPTLDKAIKSVPRIYEAMNQAVDAPRCEDPFIDLAAALRGDAQRPSKREAPTMAPGHEIAIRAVGTALAGMSVGIRRLYARLRRGEDAHQRPRTPGDLRPAARQRGRSVSGRGSRPAGRGRRRAPSTWRRPVRSPFPRPRPRQNRGRSRSSRPARIASG